MPFQGPLFLICSWGVGRNTLVRFYVSILLSADLSASHWVAKNRAHFGHRVAALFRWGRMSPAGPRPCLDMHLGTPRLGTPHQGYHGYPLHLPAATPRNYVRSDPCLAGYVGSAQLMLHKLCTRPPRGPPPFPLGWLVTVGSRSLWFEVWDECFHFALQSVDVL